MENVLQKKKISELLLPVQIKNVRVQGRGCYNRPSKTNLPYLKFCSGAINGSNLDFFIKFKCITVLRDEIQILL